MYNPETYLNATINDIVFENRNKAYGAYQLRSNASRYVTYAMCFGLLATLMLSVFSLKAGKSTEEPIKPQIISCPMVVDVVLEQKKIELPQPESPAPQKAQPTIQYTEFVARTDNSVTDDKVSTIDDLKGRAISTFTNDIDSVGGDIPIIEARRVVTEPVVKRDETFTFVEQQPEYNGGFLAMQKYIGAHIKYPKYALAQGIEGTVYVELVVDQYGNVGEVKTVRGIGFGCDEAAEEVIAGMPKWFPGKQNGNPVRVRLTLPIKFDAIED
jgi:protein TonB